MKAKLIAFAGIIALSNLAPLQAGEVAAEIADTATNKVNESFISEITDNFLNKNYPTLHVTRIGHLRTFILGGVTYQCSLILIKEDNSSNGYIMDYLYDTDLQRHTFVNPYQLNDLLRTGNPDPAFISDPSRVLEGQWDK